MTTWNTCAMCGYEIKRSCSYVVDGKTLCYTCYGEANGDITVEILDRRLKVVEEEMRKIKEVKG